jgi:hypothetical protein
MWPAGRQLYYGVLTAPESKEDGLCIENLLGIPATSLIIITAIIIAIIPIILLSVGSNSHFHVL